MIETLLLNSLCIIGFHIATEEGMILHWVEQLTQSWSDKLTKPIWSCPYCMSSVHSTYFAIPMIYSGRLELWQYPIYILALCGTTVITYNIARIVREY